jgi:hypothetical protein
MSTLESLPKGANVCARAAGADATATRTAAANAARLTSVSGGG